MKKILFTVVLILVLVGCSMEQPEEMTLSLSFPDESGEYLNGSQIEEWQFLIDAFNRTAGSDWYMWTDHRTTDEGAYQFNCYLEENNIIGIFVDICKDGSLYVCSTWERAGLIAKELNEMNTNSFSRAMFFVDNCSKIVTGKKVSIYDSNKDIFGGN